MAAGPSHYGSWGSAPISTDPNASLTFVAPPDPLREAREERDRYIRLFNRLEAAISHHEKADRFQDDNDLALYAARDKILKDAAR